MRRIELIWEDGEWADGVAERILSELIEGLEINGSEPPDEAYLSDRLAPLREA